MRLGRASSDARTKHEASFTFCYSLLEPPMSNAPQRPLLPRKQPRQQRAHDTMESILEAAAQVHRDRGLEKDDHHQVALRAGMSVGSLYQYSPSKDAILYALLERKFGRVVRKLEASIEGSRGESLEARTSALIEALFREEGRARASSAPSSRQAPRLDKRRRAHMADQVHRLVHGMLEEHRTELGVQDLELASWMLVQAVTGIADAAMLGPLEELRDPAFIDAVTDHALGALGRKRRRRNTLSDDCCRTLSRYTVKVALTFTSSASQSSMNPRCQRMTSPRASEAAPPRVVSMSRAMVS